MTHTEHDPHRTRNLAAGVVAALAIVGVFVLAVGGVRGFIALTMFIGLWALLAYLLHKPTRQGRFWAAVLQPYTLFLLFMPKKISSDIKDLQDRETRQP